MKNFLASSRFSFGDKVVIDRDQSLVAVVTAFSFRQPDYRTVGISYVHNGDSRSAWIEEWRLDYPK